MPSLYDIPVTTLKGEPTTLAPYKGKALLIVNVASKCGFTKQYTALEALYQQKKDSGLVVLGFPSNDFGEQEPGTDAEIANFCSTEYPVTFPLFSKIPVNSPDRHPLYTELIAQHPALDADATQLRTGLDDFARSKGLPLRPPPPAILWNFEKFVVARDGSIIARYASDVAPDDPRLTEAIEKALA